MLEKTRGILIHQLKYSETSVIATIYTENFGRQSYIINGVHSKNATVKAAVLQPLFLLDLEVYHKPGRDLHRLKNAKIEAPYTSIPYDIRKSTVVIFLAEMLNKCMKEEDPNHELFEFIFHSLTFFDLTEKGIANFHLWFLFKLTTYLGIFPNRENLEVSNYFDMEKARFVSREPTHLKYMDKRTTEIFSRLFDMSFSNLSEFAISGSDRQILLQKIIEFYQIHFEFLGELKSLRVLKEVFN